MKPNLGSLLVVDDNELNRDMLARRLQRRGYNVCQAADGPRALEMVANERFDLILLDINMPGMDGLEVLSYLRRSQSVSDLPVIMATARDRSEDVVLALEKGANDYVTKPLDFPVVLARVETQLSLKRATRALEAAHARMKSDLDAAARIQKSLLPGVTPQMEGVHFAWTFQPCDELAGDILGICPLGCNQAALYLLDVSGHGVPAALLSVTLNRILSNTTTGSVILAGNEGSGNADQPARPARVASRLNQRFRMNPDTNQYFTILYGVLDLAAAELRFVSAGHPGPLLLASGRPAKVLEGSGFPVGWFPQPDYEDITVPLSPGDRVYFYSDGIVEAQNADGELFSADRLGQQIEAWREASLQESVVRVLESVRAWSAEVGVDDDISILALELPSGASGVAPR